MHKEKDVFVLMVVTAPSSGCCCSTVVKLSLLMLWWILLKCCSQTPPPLFPIILSLLLALFLPRRRRSQVMMWRVSVAKERTSLRAEEQRFNATRVLAQSNTSHAGVWLAGGAAATASLSRIQQTSRAAALFCFLFEWSETSTEMRGLAIIHGLHKKMSLFFKFSRKETETWFDFLCTFGEICLRPQRVRNEAPPPTLPARPPE